MLRRPRPLLSARIALAPVAALALAVAACGPATPAAPTAAPAKPTEPAAKPTAAPAAATSAPAQPTAAAAPKPTGAPKPAAATKPSVAQLRIAIPNDEGALTPYTYKFGYPGLQMLFMVYDTLMQLDAEQVPQPLLARDVKASSDGLTYEIALRPGIRWHDGKPLTADDVKFTYEYFIANTSGRFSPPLRTSVDSITTSGAEAVTIKLKAANPSFPVRALADIPIMPRHVWEGVPAEKTKETLATIGSGPYKLLEASETLYRMQANTDYFLGAPTVNELLWPVIKDLNTALQALRTGEIQGLTTEMPPEQIQQFNQGPLKVAKGPNFASTLLQLNTERPPFDKKEVRQAIDLAIDKQRLVDTILLGNGTVATPGFVHPTLGWHDASVQARFDVARARQLLDQVGAAPGSDGIRSLNGEQMEFTLLVYSTQPLRIRAAEVIGTMLKDVGIQTTVRALDPNATDALVWPEFDAAKGRDYDMSIWGWSAPVQIDPGRLPDLVHSDFSIGRSNIGALKSSTVDQLANEVRMTVDDAKRMQAVKSLEKAIADEVPFVMLYFQDGNYGYRAQTYDNWVYQKGQGIYTKLSFIQGFGR
jgi:peptide/nickel transport system substrate-binding protein